MNIIQIHFSVCDINTCKEYIYLCCLHFIELTHFIFIKLKFLPEDWKPLKIDQKCGLKLSEFHNLQSIFNFKAQICHNDFSNKIHISFKFCSNSKYLRIYMITFRISLKCIYFPQKKNDEGKIGKQSYFLDVQSLRVQGGF